LDFPDGKTKEKYNASCYFSHVSHGSYERLGLEMKKNNVYPPDWATIVMEIKREAG
jgi:hypothetical protein